MESCQKDKKGDQFLIFFVGMNFDNQVAVMWFSAEFDFLTARFLFVGTLKFFTCTLQNSFCGKKMNVLFSEQLVDLTPSYTSKTTPYQNANKYIQGV